MTGRWAPATSGRSGAAGVSLLEAVIVIAIVGILAAIVAPLLDSGFRAYTEGRAIAERERQATLALERFVRDVRGADQGTIEWISDTQLQLERDETVIAYEFDGPALEVSYGDDDPRPLARNLVEGSGVFDEPEEINDVTYYTVSFDVQDSGVLFQTTAVARRP